MVDSDSIAALQAENARLIALLQSNGIDWRLPAEPEPIVTMELNPQGSAPPKKWLYFDGCFGVAQMSFRSAGKGNQAESLVMRPPAPTSGGPAFAKNHASNVRSVATVY